MKKSPECISALQKIVFAIPTAKRLELRLHIELLQKQLGDASDLLIDRRGKHWAERKLKVEVRGQGSFEATQDEICSQIKRTKKQLQMALSLGRGRASFTVENEIFTIIRL